MKKVPSAILLATKDTLIDVAAVVEAFVLVVVLCQIFRQITPDVYSLGSLTMGVFLYLMVWEMALDRLRKPKENGSEAK